MLKFIPSRLLRLSRYEAVCRNASLAPHVARRVGLPSTSSSVARYSTSPAGAVSVEAETSVVSPVEKPTPDNASAPNRAPGHVISTLDPTKLIPSDYCDFSELAKGTIQTSEPDADGNPMQYDFLHPPSKARVFPKGTAGFLYLHKPPLWAPQILQAIRFRVTNNSDPSSFAAGHDLQFEGLPWLIPLVYGSFNAPAIQTLLAHDGLQLPLREMKSLATRIITQGAEPHWRLLYGAQQPFPLILSFKYNPVIMIAECPVEQNTEAVQDTTPKYLISKRRLYLPAITVKAKVWAPADNTAGSQNIPKPRETWRNLYEGKRFLCAVIARLEPLQDNPQRAFVRILKIVRPIVPNPLSGVDPSIMPEITEGSLLPQYNQKTGKFDDAPYSFAGGLAFASLPKNAIQMVDL